MFTYFLAKAHQDQVLREAEQARLARITKRAKREAGKKSLQTKGWASRRLRATHA